MDRCLDGCRYNYEPDAVLARIEATIPSKSLSIRGRTANDLYSVRARVRKPDGREYIVNPRRLASLTLKPGFTWAPWKE